MDNKRRLIQLLDVIKHHNHLYHVLDKPEITDGEFDLLIKERDEILSADPSLTELLNNETPVDIKLPKGGLTKIKHEQQMASLENVFDMEGVNNFFSRFPVTTEFVYEHKMDGLALELRYENGKPQMMLTRGDGSFGEDVTHQIGIFGDIPTIPYIGKVIIRGEGTLSNEQFKRLNALSTKQYKTARNAIAGLVRRLELSPEHTELGTFIPYALIGEPFEELDYSERKAQLSEWGFTDPERASLNNITQNLRSTTYPTDGIVIKVDSHEEALKAGETNHHPKWAVAYKYPPEVKTSILTSVLWETGRLGAITPVAIYNPINLGGTTNDRATLHNFKQFQRHQLRIGAEIQICRAGDVIPYFVGVVKEGKGAMIKAPSKCPSCDEPVTFDGSDGEDIFIQCNNFTGCPAQRTKRYLNFVDKDGLNIRDLGTAKVDWLVTNNVVTEYKDFFRMTEFGADIPESVISGLVLDKIIANAERARTVEASRFVKALGLPSIGVGNAKTIANEAKDADDLLALLEDADRLKALPGIEWATAFMVVNALRNNNESLKREIMRVLPELNLVFSDSVKLVGQVCVSGKFPVPRDDLKSYLRSLGYEAVSSITGKTCGMIAGYDAIERKVNKAVEKGQWVLDTANKSFEQIKEEFKTLSGADNE